MRYEPKMFIKLIGLCMVYVVCVYVSSEPLSQETKCDGHW